MIVSLRSITNSSITAKFCIPFPKFAPFEEELHHHCIFASCVFYYLNSYIFTIVSLIISRQLSAHSIHLFLQQFWIAYHRIFKRLSLADTKADTIEPKVYQVVHPFITSFLKYIYLLNWVSDLLFIWYEHAITSLSPLGINVPKKNVKADLYVHRICFYRFSLLL